MSQSQAPPYETVLVAPSHGVERKGVSEQSQAGTILDGGGPCAVPGAGAVGPASLDKDSHKSKHIPWSRRQKRIYQRVQSLLSYWGAHGFMVRWVMLSTAPGGNADQLANHHDRLLKRIEREFGFPGIQHFFVRTREGHGVLHCLWAWRGAYPFYVPQAWLSEEWARLHGAEVVWIKKVRTGYRGRRGLSRYVVGQYVADQCGLVSMGWSWQKTFGFPYVQVWARFRRVMRDRPYRETVDRWSDMMEGKEILLPDGRLFHLGNLGELVGVSAWEKRARGRGAVARLWEDVQVFGKRARDTHPETIAKPRASQRRRRASASVDAR